jgi:hypothetical protein
MRLTSESQARVEEFFREHRGDPELMLPPISIHGGLFARLLTKVVGMSAITFGRQVFVRPELIKKDSEGRAGIPAWLLVHEAAHVLQYEERGCIRFFRDYLRGYWRALRTGKSWNRQGRMAAYMSIEEEREAYTAERLYAGAGVAFIDEHRRKKAVT